MANTLYSQYLYEKTGMIGLGKFKLRQKTHIFMFRFMLHSIFLTGIVC